MGEINGFLQQARAALLRGREMITRPIAVAQTAVNGSGVASGGSHGQGPGMGNPPGVSAPGGGSGTGNNPIINAGGEVVDLDQFDDGSGIVDVPSSGGNGTGGSPITNADGDGSTVVDPGVDGPVGGDGDMVGNPAGGPPGIVSPGGPPGTGSNPVTGDGDPVGDPPGPMDGTNEIDPVGNGDFGGNQGGEIGDVGDAIGGPPGPMDGTNEIDPVGDGDSGGPPGVIGSVGDAIGGADSLSTGPSRPADPESVTGLENNTLDGLNNTDSSGAGTMTTEQLTGQVEIDTTLVSGSVGQTTDNTERVTHNADGTTSVINQDTITTGASVGAGIGLVNLEVASGVTNVHRLENAGDTQAVQASINGNGGLIDTSDVSAIPVGLTVTEIGEEGFDYFDSGETESVSLGQGLSIGANLPGDIFDVEFSNESTGTMSNTTVAGLETTVVTNNGDTTTVATGETHIHETTYTVENTDASITVGNNGLVPSDTYTNTNTTYTTVTQGMEHPNSGAGRSEAQIQADNGNITLDESGLYNNTTQVVNNSVTTFLPASNTLVTPGAVVGSGEPEVLSTRVEQTTTVEHMQGEANGLPDNGFIGTGIGGDELIGTSSSTSISQAGLTVTQSSDFQGEGEPNLERVHVNTSAGSSISMSPEELQRQAQNALQDHPDNETLQAIANGESATEAISDSNESDALEAFDAIGRENGSAGLADEDPDTPPREPNTGDGPTAPGTVSGPVGESEQNPLPGPGEGSLDAAEGTISNTGGTSDPGPGEGSLGAAEGTVSNTGGTSDPGQGEGSLGAAEGTISDTGGTSDPGQGEGSPGATEGTVSNTGGTSDPGEGEDSGEPTAATASDPVAGTSEPGVGEGSIDAAEATVSNTGGTSDPVADTEVDTPTVVSQTTTIEEAPDGGNPGFSVSNSTDVIPGESVSQTTQATASEGSSIDASNEDVQQAAQDAVDNGSTNPIVQDVANGATLTEAINNDANSGSGIITDGHENDDAVDAIDEIGDRLEENTGDSDIEDPADSDFEDPADTDEPEEPSFTPDITGSPLDSNPVQPETEESDFEDPADEDEPEEPSFTPDITGSPLDSNPVQPEREESDYEDPSDSDGGGTQNTEGDTDSGGDDSDSDSDDSDSDNDDSPTENPHTK